MKKRMRKMLLMPIIGLVLIVLGLCMGSFGQEEIYSDLLLENIEALASGEDHTTVFCYGEGSIDCPNGKKVKYIMETSSLEY